MHCNGLCPTKGVDVVQLASNMHDYWDLHILIGRHCRVSQQITPRHIISHHATQQENQSTSDAEANAFNSLFCLISVK